MASLLYLAYGSNLHPLRLAARVPSVRVIGVVELPGHRLAFHKRGMDGSGKCLVYTERDGRHRAYGVLYEFAAEDKAGLDAFEGEGYHEQTLLCHLSGRVYAPYTYVARPTHIDPSLLPYHWYKNLVLAGARHHRFPSEYIASIAARPSMDDPDAERAGEYAKLLRRLEVAEPCLSTEPTAFRPSQVHNT